MYLEQREDGGRLVGALQQADLGALPDTRMYVGISVSTGG